MRENEIWTSIHNIMENINNDKKNKHKELWIPSFNIQTNNSDMLQNMVGGTINGKFIRSVRVVIT